MSALDPLSPQPGVAAPQAASGELQAPPHILVVDDDLINQKVLVNLLKRKGWNATAAGNGRKCLELLAAGRFDLVLLDIQMPEMDGFETAERIRQWERERATPASPPARLPIVALTTVSQPGTKEKCLECGMDEHLTKPVNTTELYAAIQRILRLPG